MVDVVGFVNNVLFGLDYYNYYIDIDYCCWCIVWGVGDIIYSIDFENLDYIIFRFDVMFIIFMVEK